MDKIKLHPKKLYSLIIAGAAFIGLVLPWQTFGNGMFGASSSVNGFRDWGLLTLLGIVGVTVASLVEDQTKDFYGNMRMVVIGGFVATMLGAFITLMKFMGINGVGTGFGIWLTMLAGLAGLLWVTGVIKPPTKHTAPPTS